MASNQLYSLTWGDFGTSLISAVQLLRCHGDLVDVTLAAGGRCFSAHKIVLCAASPFLLDLLKSTPCKHPVVMLAGVTAADLEALLEFVYRGEVSIDPSQLPSLLQAAHCLNIQGLSPAANDNQQTMQSTIKAVIDMVKSDEVTQTNLAVNETLSRDVINTLLPIRRKKRMKRKDSLTTRNKWPRHEMPTNTDNRNLEQQNVQTGEQDGNEVNAASSELWTSAELGFGGVQAPALEPSGQLVVGAPATTATTSATQCKVRSASDQPGACPLCGAMLRQARNLRRHLITSCKYRDSGEAQGLAPPDRQLQRDHDLHQLQPVAVDRVLPADVACANIIVTDCTGISTLKQ